MKLFAESDTVLRDNLYQPRARNVAYLFPRSQNDIISVIGYDVVRANIAEIRKARYFSVLADAVSCHNVDNVEHMPLGLRFVDDPPIQNPAYGPVFCVHCQSMPLHHFAELSNIMLQVFFNLSKEDCVICKHKELYRTVVQTDSALELCPCFPCHHVQNNIE